MKLRLLPTTINSDGCATAHQHLCCFLIDECVALDAGSLAMATTNEQKQQIRDIVLTHAHLDHIAGLPLFIDDLFALLKSPVCIHASEQVVQTLENNIFNWEVYPRFSELKNDFGEVMRYEIFSVEKEFSVAHLRMRAIGVNHKVPSCGFVISDDKSKIAVTGDTAEMDRFWEVVNAEENPNALLIECAFPDKLSELAQNSHHLTPLRLNSELKKFTHKNCPIYVINIKPMYRKTVIAEIEDLKIPNLEILKIGQDYNF